MLCCIVHVHASRWNGLNTDETRASAVLLSANTNNRLRPQDNFVRHSSSTGSLSSLESRVRNMAVSGDSSTANDGQPANSSSSTGPTRAQGRGAMSPMEGAGSGASEAGAPAQRGPSPQQQGGQAQSGGAPNTGKKAGAQKGNSDALLFTYQLKPTPAEPAGVCLCPSFFHGLPAMRVVSTPSLCCHYRCGSVATSWAYLLRPTSHMRTRPYPCANVCACVVCYPAQNPRCPRTSSRCTTTLRTWLRRRSKRFWWT